MDISKFAETVSDIDRLKIKESIDKNNEYMKNYPKHHAESIKFLFEAWHNVFPREKQDIKCSSCRNAVFKFWELVNENWNETVENE